MTTAPGYNYFWRRKATSSHRRGCRLLSVIVLVSLLVALSSSSSQYLDLEAYGGSLSSSVTQSATTSSSSSKTGSSSSPPTTTPRLQNATNTVATAATATTTTTTTTSIPPPFHAKNPAQRYPRNQSPFLHSEGYQPAGGRLPVDAADYLEDPRMWRFVDNATCIDKNTNNGNGNSTNGKTVSAVEEWQYRAPYAILLGAMKAGTHAVIESLWEHPWVVPTGHWELHFYDSPKAIRNEKGIQRDTTLRNYAEAVKKAVGPNISVESTFMWNNDDRRNTSNKKQIPMIMVESSPRYLLNSDRIPDLILCVSPWVKLMAILRNPVARVESHYRFRDESLRVDNQSKMVDWQVWIDDDLRLLRKAGVLNATTPEEEYLAWKYYQRRPHSQQIVGRGLYVIPLEHYLRAMERGGKPRSDLYVLQSERFVEDRQEEYGKLLKFLELPPHRLSDPFAKIHKTTLAGGTIPMPDAIRHQLEALYRPYNARLYELLGWDNVWG